MVPFLAATNTFCRIERKEANMGESDGKRQPKKAVLPCVTFCGERTDVLWSDRLSENVWISGSTRWLRIECSGILGMGSGLDAAADLTRFIGGSSLAQERMFYETVGNTTA